MNRNGQAPAPVAVSQLGQERAAGTQPHFEASPAPSLPEVVRRRWPWFLACAVVVPLVALIVSLLQEPRYAATASLLFRDYDQQLLGPRYSAPSSDPARRAATNLRLVSLDTVARRTAARLGGGLTGEDVADRVDVEAAGQSDVVDVIASDRAPARAAKLANAFADDYLEYSRHAARARLRQALAGVERDLAVLTPAQRSGPAGRALRDRAAELGALMSLRRGDAELAQRAEPPERPAAPSPRRNTAIGLVLGLLLGLGAAVMRERADRRLRTSTEIEEVFGSPVLGTLPELRPPANGMGVQRWLGVPGVVPPHRMQADAAEAFRLLRANLKYSDVGRGLTSVAVNSPSPGEGKSTVAWNLAAVAAQAGTVALLIDADLRRAGLGGRVDEAPALGLSDVLVGESTLNDSVVAVPVLDRPEDMSLLATFDLLLAGTPLPNSAEVLESDRMRALLAEATERYELVIIDTPSATFASEAIPLLKMIDGVLVVSRLGSTTREAASRLCDELNVLRVPILGVALNCVRRRLGSEQAHHSRQVEARVARAR